MTFKYMAYTANRTIIEGTLEASTERIAKETIRQSGYNLLRLRAVSPKKSFRQSMPSLFKIKDREVIAFSRQLATLVERGSNTIIALQLLKDQIRNSTFREIVSVIIHDLNEGKSLADAMSQHPQAFPHIFPQMIRISEQTGHPEVALRQAAAYMEKENAATKKVSRALVYPAFILLIAAGVVTIMLTITLPSLLDMFAQFEQELPLATRILIDTVDFLHSHLFQIVALVIGIGVLATWYVKRPSGRKRLDKALLRLPIIGDITTMRSMAHFSRTTSLLLSAGLTMPKIMDTVAQTCNNSFFREVILDIRTEMLKGQSLYYPLAANKIFPTLLVQMVRVGEQVGTLDKDLMTLAETYEQETSDKTEWLLSMIEPSLLLILGLIVGFIAVSIIMPIYTIMGSV